VSVAIKRGQVLFSTETEDIVEIRYQATTGEDPARWEDLARGAVVSEIVIVNVI
jgi:hypothetical protein